VAKVLLTGANGPIGTHLVSHLRERHQLRLSWWDPAAPPGLPGWAHPDWAQPGDDVRRADIADRDAVHDLMDGIDAVVHLAALRGPTAAWSELLGPNIDGVHNIFEEAAASGVRRVVLASSAHVAGGWLPDAPSTITHHVPVRPDSLSAVTEVFGEAVGRLVSDRWGLSVICLRIGDVSERPGADPLRPWLSPADLRQLIDCALTAPVRFGVYYGVSPHADTPWDTKHAEQDLNYHPVGATR
jgi:NAD+ dependent glucose-6-phosphate dehydrogenase